MRIALVAHNASPLNPTDGAETGSQAAQVASLARALADIGHRVTIYARKDSPKLPASAILAPGVAIEHLTAGPAQPLAPDKLAGHVREFADQLAQRWRRHKPDVAHAHFWTSGLAALYAARDLEVPVVQTFHSLGIAEWRHRVPDRGSTARIRLEACIARSAAAVLASTSEQAADLASMGVPRARVAVVPCGVDTDRFAPDGPAARRNGRKRLLATAQAAGRPGLDTLVRALAAVPDAELVIAGGPAPTEARKTKAYRELSRLAKSLRVDTRLTFAGKIPDKDLPALIRSADLLISAAPYESCGGVAIAAMACGTPVAASAVGGYIDAVVDGTNGVLVPPGRPDMLARRVRDLLSSPIRLEALGIAAADRAKSRYSWVRIAHETVAAYQRCRPLSTPPEPVDDAGEEEAADASPALLPVKAARA
jgi:D-inositol-3-phosphate glycosyltransferase